MNALDRKIMTDGKTLRAARFLGAAASAALLASCAAFPVASAKVDPSSPIAPEVARVARTNTAYPKFSDIPPAPKDVRPARVYGQRAAELEAAKSGLDQATAANTWSLSNTQGFASQVRRQAGPDYNAAAAANGAEAFANTLRKRATPPPPANQ